ncbi:transglycosylase SLT domain-containing protein [Kribbella sp. NPDC055071]
MAKGWWWVALGVVVVGLVAARTDSKPKALEATHPTTAAKSTPSATPKATTTPSAKPWYDDYDPAHFAAQVRRSAQQAGVNPQLLMAILYNEAYKPHDPEFERSWASVDSNPAFGIANMHKPAFDDTKRGRSFANRKWEQLPDDPALAIQAAAWHLHDLARRIPDKRSNLYTKDELLALGYNAGGGNMRKFATGTKAGSQAQSYLDRLHDNWDKSGQAVRG